MRKIKDISNQKYGRLTAINRKVINKKSFWLCKCNCGKEVIVDLTHLRSGDTRSCGCLNRDAIIERNKKSVKHNLSRTLIYRVWARMMDRCYNKNVRNYYRYGGRGIEVCKRWHNIYNFINDMGNLPPPKMQINRINNNGNYEPLNCKWSTPMENSHNRISSVLLEYNSEIKCLSEWARIVKIPQSTISRKIKKGMSLYDIVEERDKKCKK